MSKTKSAANQRGVLICTRGAKAKEMVKLRRDSTIFGREKADIILSDPEVSSTHCQIQNVDDTYILFDMNSSNGTFLNGKKVIKSTLKEGDRIAIGRTEFRFALEDEKNVRHIPTLFSSNRIKQRSNSLVDTLIEEELKAAGEVKMILKVLYPNKATEVIEVRQSKTFIGRASSFGHFDQDTEISRKHLLIKVNETGEIFVEDQGSTNGSFINGKRITGMHLVKANDEVRVGRCCIKLFLPKQAPRI